MSMEEIWKDIPSYEGLYEASTLGRIRTKEGKATSSKRFPVRVWKQRILKQKYGRRTTGGHKDARVMLWKDGKEKTWLVSRLVAMTWCEGYDKKLTVNHKDGNPNNNNADNLEWLSLADNIRHGFENGLFSTQNESILMDENGKEYTFRSNVQAALFLGRSKSYLYNRVKHNKMNDVVANDGRIFKVIKI